MLVLHTYKNKYLKKKLYYSVTNIDKEHIKVNNTDGLRSNDTLSFSSKNAWKLLLEYLEGKTLGIVNLSKCNLNTYANLKRSSMNQEFRKHTHQTLAMYFFVTHSVVLVE